MTKKEYQTLQASKRGLSSTPSTLADYLKLENYKILKIEDNKMFLKDLLLNESFSIDLEDLKERFEFWIKCKDYEIKDLENVFNEENLQNMV